MAFEAFSNFFNDPSNVAKFQVAAGTTGAAIAPDNPFAVAAGNLAAESGKAFQQQQLLTTLEGEQGAAAEEAITPSALETPAVPQSGSIGSISTPSLGFGQPGATSSFGLPVAGSTPTTTPATSGLAKPELDTNQKLAQLLFGA